jgi:DNA-binding transcriptional LysR family regulator
MINPIMELRQLRHLLALAETGSFSRAAEQLHLTQSALSRSIQTLEDELGGALLDRIGKRNELTPMGVSVADYARRIVEEANDLRSNLPQLRQGRMGSLRIGLGSGPGALLMTPLLQHMARYEPLVRTEVQRGATELLLMQLRSRRLDALVIDVRRIVPAPDLLMEQMADLRAGFICRAGHPLAQQAKKGARRQKPPPGVAFEALLDYPMASVPLSDEVARQLVDVYGARANPAQMITLCCEEISSLIDTVRQTDAIFLGICAAAKEGLNRGELVELTVMPAMLAKAKFALISLAGRTENAGIGFLRRFVAEHLKD